MRSIRSISLPMMFVLCSVTLGHSHARSFQKARLEDRRAEIEALIKASGAETVSVAVIDLDTRQTLLINEKVEMHAASTMKVPVMMEVFRLAAGKKLKLGDQVPLKNSFASIVDGSSYELDPKDDSAPDFYDRIGETASIRELVEAMITRSSNLATNLLIDRIGAKEITAGARLAGATSINVRRGVEDGKAFRAGISNTTTANDLMVLLQALAEERFVRPPLSNELLDILLRQEFNEALPAGLPPDVPVAHKTGSITKIKHDAGIVFPTDRRPYVIVVLTRGIADEAQSNRLIAAISKVVYNALVPPPKAAT